MAALGCKTVLLTNAAGGIADRLQPGDLMLITDHINLTARNPLVGHAGAFIDMTQTYDPSLANAARGAAQSAGVALKEGVYVGVLGPSYETPAEVRMLGRLGADAVGMSTVCEAIALRHAQVRVGAVSCITNAAATSDGPTLSHDDVKEQAARANSRFVSLLGRWIERIGGRT
jgi:purine-nucleoside phosphorylase